jgi:hypothetical protein
MNSTRVAHAFAFALQAALVSPGTEASDTAANSPILELASLSQETRDSAAAILRQSYTAPPATNWDTLISSLKLGSRRTNVLNQLVSLKLQPEGGIGSGNTDTVLYRLDSSWVLECSFTNSTADGRLSRRRLSQHIQDVWVEPPHGFSGVWKTYYANGQPSHQISYQGGLQEGEVILYRSDGTKSVVSHLINGMAEGKEEGFYPSGKVAYKGQHKAGAQVGTWTWYKEDGSVESNKEFP